VLFVLSCLSKPMALTFPVVLVLYDHFFLKRKVRENYAAYIPYLLCAGWCAWNTLQDVGHGSLIEGVEQYSSVEKILLPFYGICFYAVKFFAPVHLSAIYPYPQKPLLLFAGAFVLCCVLLFFVFRYRKQKPLLVAGVVFYIVTLLPVLQIIPNTFSIVADRYFYLSSLGIIVPLVFWLQGLLNTQRSFAMVLSAATIIFCIASFNRSKIWSNSENLFSDVIKKYPKEYRGYLNRGSYYLESGKFSPAMADLSKAYQLQPSDPKVLVSYGWALLATTGNRTEAEKLFNDCIALDPDNSEALNNLGSIYGIQTEYDKAFLYINKAKRINPFDPKINYNLAFTFLKTEAKDSAVFYFRRAAEEGSEQAAEQLRRMGY
jgi:tetratricopeptide (TPR) repeat protein